jgi:hypothetical protein
VQVECRRMGGGFGGKESQSALFACVAAVAAARLQRPVKLRLDRDDDFLVTGRRHGFSLRLGGRLRRRGPHPGRRGHDGVQRRPLGRPVGPVMTRALCHFDNAYWLPARGHARLLGPHEHAEQHRVPRLRRAAGRHRRRIHADRQRWRAGWGATRWRCGAPTSTARRAQRHALRPGGGRQHHPRAGGPAGRQQRLRRPRAPPSRPSTPAARC